jgi:hypothetical protein
MGQEVYSLVLCILLICIFQLHPRVYAQSIPDALNPDAMGNVQSRGNVPVQTHPSYKLSTYTTSREALDAYAQWHTQILNNPDACKSTDVLVWEATAVSSRISYR